jgi:hypothetical protein
MDAYINETPKGTSLRQTPRRLSHHACLCDAPFGRYAIARKKTNNKNHVQRVSAKHGVKDDFAFLWEHAIFRHPPNKNPLTDRSEILHN